MSTESLWFPYNHFNTAANLRLFCFSHAGGSAQSYHKWKSLYPSFIEVCPIQLPGRLNRYLEPPFKKMEPLVQALSQAMQPLLDKAFVFFGHSFGAFVAYEVAQYLRKNQNISPCYLIVSGQRAPQIVKKKKTIYHLNDTDLITELERNYLAIPQEILNSAEMKKMTLDLLRADFEVLDNYQYTCAPPLACPILTVCGQQDSFFSPTDLEAWTEQTTNSFMLRMFPGDHFYLNLDPQRKELVDLITSCLRQGNKI